MNVGGGGEILGVRQTVFGGTSCLVMGLVFKTSGLAARVVAGGFDSHVPPPRKPGTD